ncbi:MAG: molybdate ABC transporter substrate-binding protein [Proteobacteria bacterium]|nr:molybdate ABC transporter substrate-binding protein [Pseudomonadota bacterium]
MFSFKKIATFTLLCFVMCRSGYAAKTELLISAASSMTAALQEIIVEFESIYPDIKVATNFAGSGTLLRQIERGAPVDLFLSADQITMQEAISKGLIYKDSVYHVARNRLILVGRDDLSFRVSRISDIMSSKVKRIAIGNPDSVPAGRYARALLIDEDLWDRVSPKLIFTQNVRQCLDYVARGEVDLAFVYVTDIRIPRDGVNGLLTLGSPSTIVYPLGLVNSTKHLKESQRFLEFLKTTKVTSILESLGFVKVLGP